jgi:hypothetical protein
MNKHTAKKTLTLGVALIGLAFGSLDARNSPAADTFLSAAEPHGTWMHLNWYGWFEVTYYPYVYHLEHGWQMVAGAGKDSVVVYDYGLCSYVMTNETVYPWIYKYGTNESWYRFAGKVGSQERWFQLAVVPALIEESTLRDVVLPDSMLKKIIEIDIIP